MVTTSRDAGIDISTHKTYLLKKKGRDFFLYKNTLTYSYKFFFKHVLTQKICPLNSEATMKKLEGKKRGRCKYCEQRP